MAANFCKKCGTPNPGDAFFCPHCGTSLEDAPLTPKVNEEPNAEAQNDTPLKTKKEKPKKAEVTTEPEPQDEVPAPAEEYQADEEYQVPPTPVTPVTPVYAAPPAPAAKASNPVTSETFKKTLSAAGTWWKARKTWQKILIIVIIVLIILFIIGRNTGPQVGDYYELGNDKVPAVGFVLGSEREVLDVQTGTKDGIQILTVQYSMPFGQAFDMASYLTILCSQGGFTMRTSADFNQPNGSAIQAWKNSIDPGYMIIVQVDYDMSGYTITVMRGEGQAPGGSGQVPAGNIGGFDQGSGGFDQEYGGDVGDVDYEDDPGYPEDDFGYEENTSGSIIPSGEPASSTTLNGLAVATYSDGTISVADGQGVITPDGKIYINGSYKESNGPIHVPDEGSSVTINGGKVTTSDGKFYIAANGSVLLIDTESGIAAAYDEA